MTRKTMKRRTSKIDVSFSCLSCVSCLSSCVSSKVSPWKMRDDKPPLRVREDRHSHSRSLCSQHYGRRGCQMLDQKTKGGRLGRCRPGRYQRPCVCSRQGRSLIQGRRSPVAVHWSPVAGRRLPVAGRRLSVFGRRSLDADSRSAAGGWLAIGCCSATGSWLPVAGRRSLVAGCRLPVADL